MHEAVSKLNLIQVKPIRGMMTQVLPIRRDKCCIIEVSGVQASFHGNVEVQWSPWKQENRSQRL